MSPKTYFEGPLKWVQTKKQVENDEIKATSQIIMINKKGLGKRLGFKFLSIELTETCDLRSIS